MGSRQRKVGSSRALRCVPAPPLFILQMKYNHIKRRVVLLEDVNTYHGLGSTLSCLAICIFVMLREPINSWADVLYDGPLINLAVIAHAVSSAPRAQGA